MNISIYDKAGVEIASVVVGSNSFVFSQIMGENYLQLEFKHGDYIDIRRDSYCVYGGVKYTLIQAVVVDKISTVEYNYTARFEAPQELLKNIIMTHMAGEGQTLTKAYERNFSLAGTAQEHVEMLLRNTGRLNANFSIGTIDTSLTGVKVVAYNVVDCKSALQLIANAFETEWWVEGNETNGYTVNLGKCSFSESSPTPLAYGYNNGVLGGAKRQLHKDAQRMTHIAVQGGSRNINTLSQLPNVPAYQFSTLHLPLLVNAVDGVGTIYYDVKNNKFEGETGFVFANSVLLTIDRNANTMTSSLFTEGEDVVVERAYDLSEYYPQKTRKVTAFAFQRNNTEFYIEDSTIETACDYKAYQLGGEKITIVFQTGALAGKTFDVINYDHINRRFECALADYDTISMPSVDIEMWRPVADSVYGGDEFIVYGTALPRTYFADTTTDPYSGAEWDMCRRTASILCENFNDKFSYSLPIDANWLSRRTQQERERLRCGFWVHFSDNQLCGGGEDIRITAVKQYLTRPLQPELTVGDEVKRVSVAQKLTQIESHISATYNYVKTVEERTQQGLQLVEDTQSEIIETSEDVQNYKGRINVTDLLAIPVAEIGANDLYLVYSEGNATEGWSDGGTFTLNGETYNDGTFVQYINGGWEAVEKEVDLTNYMRFNELPSTVSMIEATYADTSYNNLYGEGKGGLAVARIGNYRLDENGVYQPVFVEKGTAGQQYFSRNYTKTIYVPWARSYEQGGQTIYEGGAMSPADYETFKNLSSGGGGTTYTFQSGTNSFTVTPSDTGVAQVVSVTPSITTDATPTANSTNPVQSGGVKSALDGKSDTGHKHSASDITDLPTIPTDVVKYVSQTLTTNQQAQARTNIGAGTSNFSGVYDDLTNKPTIPSPTPVVDNLTSTSTTSALSANQGKALNDGKMNADASNANNAALQTFLNNATYTSSAVTDDDSVMMYIGASQMWKEVALTTLADYIDAPNLSLSATPTNDEKRLLYLSSSSAKTITATLSPLSVDTNKHSVMGDSCLSSANYSFSVGYGNTAGGTGPAFIGGGRNNTISGTFAGKAICGGESNSVTGSASGVFVGHHNTVTAENAAVVAGYYNTADCDACLVAGKYSKGLADARADHAGFDSASLMFRIGNGKNTTNRANLLEVWSNGKAFVGGNPIAIEPIKLRCERSNGVWTVTQIAGTAITATLAFGARNTGFSNIGYTLSLNGANLPSYFTFNVSLVTSNMDTTDYEVKKMGIFSSNKVYWEVWSAGGSSSIDVTDRKMIVTII